MNRNRHVLLIAVEMTHPISDESEKTATELLARDISKFLKDPANDWGYGRARVEGVYRHVESITSAYTDAAA